MPPSRTGSIEPFKRADGTTYNRARIRHLDGFRERVDVPQKHCTPAGGLTGRERAEQWATAMQEDEDETHELYERRKERLAEEAKHNDPRKGETVTLWSKGWLKAREARGLRSVETDRGRLGKHVLPVIGKTPIVKVTREDLEKLVEDLDKRVRRAELSWKTASHAWGLVTRMFADAAAPSNAISACDRTTRRSACTVPIAASVRARSTSGLQSSCDSCRAPTCRSSGVEPSPSRPTSTCARVKVTRSSGRTSISIAAWCTSTEVWTARPAT